MEPTREESKRKPGGQVKPLDSDRYGRLTVLRAVKGGWECRCDCGTITIVRGANLRTGITRSCGCLHREGLVARNATHGKAGRRRKSGAYGSWTRMRQRCNNPNNPDYKWYGGRGIAICERWNDFAAFLEDMGEPAPSMTIDRIDSDGNYEPGNCRWITIQEQQRNRRSNMKITVNGVTRILVEWCEELGLNYGTTASRIAQGWPPELALDSNAKWRRVPSPPRVPKGHVRGERSPHAKLTEDDVLGSRPIHRLERRMTADSRLARCAWCGDPMYDGPRPHDLIDCRTRLEQDALVDCPDCGGPHPAPCIYRDEAAAWRTLGIPIAPRQLRQINDQKEHRE